MLIATQLVKLIPLLSSFYETQGSSLCSQQTATGSYPETGASNQHLPILFPQDPF